MPSSAPTPASATLEQVAVLPNDQALIAPLIERLQQDAKPVLGDDASRLRRLGVALHEALTNAMLHGNLELSSDLRETDEITYHRLAAERCGLSPYRDRRVHVIARLRTDEVAFIIRDEGRGFDPTKVPDPTDPDNLTRVSGRGLLMIRSFMDHVEHNCTGNEITLVKRA